MADSIKENVDKLAQAFRDKMGVNLSDFIVPNDKPKTENSKPEANRADSTDSTDSGVTLETLHAVVLRFAAKAPVRFCANAKSSLPSKPGQVCSLEIWFPTSKFPEATHAELSKYGFVLVDAEAKQEGEAGYKRRWEASCTPGKAG